MTGSEVVQLYISLPTGHLTHPSSQLRAFHKVKELAPGKSQAVKMVLDKYAFSYWHDGIHRWMADKGTYIVRVGASSDKMEREASFEIGTAFEWSGL